MAFILGTLTAVLGLTALAAVVRTRRRVRAPLYESLREERRRQVEETRDRIRGLRSPSSPPLAAAANPALGTALNPPAPLASDPPRPRSSMAAREEPLAQAVAGHAALLAALVSILLGVFLLLAGTR